MPKELLHLKAIYSANLGYSCLYFISWTNYQLKLQTRFPNDCIMPTDSLFFFFSTPPGFLYYLQGTLMRLFNYFQVRNNTYRIWGHISKDNLPGFSMLITLCILFSFFLLSLNHYMTKTDKKPPQKTSDFPWKGAQWHCLLQNQVAEYPDQVQKENACVRGRRFLRVTEYIQNTKQSV